MLRKRTDHFKRDKLHNAQSRWRARGECITRLTPIRPPAATVIAMAGSASWKSSRLPLRCIRNPKQLLKIDLCTIHPSFINLRFQQFSMIPRLCSSRSLFGEKRTRRTG